MIAKNANSIERKKLVVFEIFAIFVFGFSTSC